MRGEPGPDQLRAWRAFLEAHAEVTAALERDLVVQRGLPLSWYDVLYTLSQASGALRMSDLSRAVLLSKSGLTRLVDRLCGAGYVTRCADANDRRGVQVSLTREGESALRRAAPVHLRGIESYFAGHVSVNEAEALTAIFGRMTSEFEPLEPITSGSEPAP